MPNAAKRPSKRSDRTAFSHCPGRCASLSLPVAQPRAVHLDDFSQFHGRVLAIVFPDRRRCPSRSERSFLPFFLGPNVAQNRIIIPTPQEPPDWLKQRPRTRKRGAKPHHPDPADATRLAKTAAACPKTWSEARFTTHCRRPPNRAATRGPHPSRSGKHVQIDVKFCCGVFCQQN